MANEEHVRKLREGVQKWNRWRKDSKEIPDLSGAKLSDANLSGADLFRADLSLAKLSDVNLSGGPRRGEPWRGTVHGGGPK
jgi:hypothetical protein